MADADARRERSTARGRLSSRTWRMGHSAWMLAPLFGFGLFTWVGFAYVGLRARRRAWWIAAVVYLVASVPLWVLGGSEATDDASSATSQWFGWGLLTIWVAGIVHAFAINRARLRWRAAHHARPWYEEGPPGAGALAPPPGAVRPPSPAAEPVSSGPVASLVGDRSELFADRPAAAVGPQPAPSPLAPASSPPAESAATDVNTADASQLRALPGVNKERARRALAERARRGGFADTKDFADAIGLQPHEYARLRPLLVCSPRPGQRRAPGRPGGRVVDY